MTRIVKDPDVRRNEILDTAQKLFYSKGYEQTAIRDIINEIGIAKGTFYHYFSSKLDLMDAMIERMLEQTLQILVPLVTDDQLSALEKLDQFFSDLADWKIENNVFFLDLLTIWYNDENAILRDKAKRFAIEKTAPFLTQIIEQGIAEGVFVTDYPAEVAVIVLQTAQSLSEALAKIFLTEAQTEEKLALIERKTAVYRYTFERILNAPTGSIKLFDLDQVKPWLKQNQTLKEVRP